MIERHKCVTMCYDIPGRTWPAELCWMYDNFAKSMTHAEVGTYCGRSLLASCGGMQKNAKVIAVDNDSDAFAPSWVKAMRRETYNLIPVGVEELNIDSLAAALVCHNRKLKFDSVFIDGCHEFAECCADIQAWLPMIRSGGIIAGHDYWPANIGVMDAVNKYFRNGFEIVSGTRIWFARIA